MGKHSRREVGLVKKTAFASAATIGATAVLSNPAQAAEVVVPNTGMTFQVDGLENVPNINAVPGINQWVPSLAGQGQQVNYTAVAEASPATSGPAAPAAGQGQAIVDAAASKIGSPELFRLLWSDQLGLQAGWQGHSAYLRGSGSIRHQDFPQRPAGW